MKKTIIFFILTLILTLIYSEEIIINNNEFQVNVISSNDTETTIEYNLGKFEITSVEINGEKHYLLGLEKEVLTFEKGAPALPKITRSIIIPNDALMNLEVVESSFVEFKMKISPSKGILSRTVNPDDVPYEFSEVYDTNAFFPNQVGELGSPYIMRDFRGITVTTYPFVYNPQTETLRVYTHLVLKVNNVGIDTENVKYSHTGKLNRFFSEIYENHFINYNLMRYVSVEEQGRIIVICYDDFVADMMPYVNWKNQKGIQTDIYNLSSIGTTASHIETFIQDEYDADNGLTFVQLIGDAAQMPCLNGNEDPAYSLLEGNDNYPEIFIGRFSAENVAQVETQVEKIIHYERDIVDGEWLHKGFGIASDDYYPSPPQGDDDEYDWQHLRNIRTDLLTYTYTDVDEFYEGSQGGEDAGGNPNSTMVSTALNAGRGIGNYTGHGSITSWSTSGFSSTHVNALTNDYMLPFIISVACSNGNFAYNCFAEAWLRATNNTTGAPTGAIAMYASTIGQSWSPPMRAQDEAVDLLVGDFKKTIGGLWYNGSCNMMDVYGTSGQNEFRHWTIFGDASLAVRTDIPIPMLVSHDPNILVGQTTFAVSTGTQNALVCLYDGTNIVGSGYTDAYGNVTLTLDPVPSTPMDLTLTITAYNKITSVETVPVIAGAGPYVIIYSYSVNAGEDDVIEAGETVYLTVTLKNIGTETATNVNMALSESDIYITLTDSYEFYGSIAAGDSVIRTNAYTFDVSITVPDNHPIHFDAEINAVEDTLYSEINLTASNPADITVDPILFEETLEPDETSSQILNIGNTGGATLDYTVTISGETRSPLLITQSITNDYFYKDPATKIPLGLTYPYTSRAYCSASGGCDEYISRVQVGDIDNSSSCSGYADYTSISTDMTMGTGYSMTVTNGNIWTGDLCDVYIDWNNDEDFEDTGEYFSLSGGPDIYTTTITPPETANTGTTRMRIRLRYYGSHNPCGSLTYGEVEDYTVNVLRDGPDWITLDGGSIVNGSISPGAANDVISVGFNATDLTDGVYTADIVITSNDPDESPVNIPVTLTVTGPPDAPTNVQIEINDTNVTISWDPVTGANSYKIYSSYVPYGTFSNLEATVTDTTWSEIIPINGKKFYKVTAE